MHSPSRFLLRWGLAALLLLGLAMLPTGRSALADPGHHGGPTFSKHNLHGRYVTSYHGFDSSITGTANEPNPPAVPYSVSGALTSDGNGNVTGYENIDYGSPGTGAAAQCTFTGTYTVSSTPGDGSVTLNLSPSCATVTCTNNSGAPSCSVGAFSPDSPTQWFCALSGPSGKSMVCTEMGEVANGSSVFQTPISAVTWASGNHG
jgi:hypothetical protein